ncbi:hypothetical protein COW36_18865 [bacterium (Candidatus Blackallbacteria) CG17_big_fil_post_rev_8_21_14_2_50_48_46]|uniref:Uncharacterized protein n=1 Tax=bacterium (Candidatus Blackallbacteria) CG17_big_fil_post_rev_8_21_14_2_50_48_46 TaxID=2014261 RepID=A0A2M7FZZ5_9BACT|nr:MAG: hypothetical protein COW64_25605 [bacterium (Candidatus Blackallbacteria) CG18_big_fil_WC_8_21_14_2_50_49_26]PIW14989.1 MAG: hypothetical protein COW36_18865 [bacterium (Candidatus Blackallbacteria) CG17_big_fil_post_rev_8_21_14_2_50_48_46]PIW50070.1 MAG: hypothetical protein COW20_03800 [bacterium (Candidatus Blackallbacteria) CG13_big_fil_rev_8_21_14_2_50_49_14]
MPDIQSRVRVAQLMTGDTPQGLYVKGEHGTFASHAEAETVAKKVADAPDQDAVILETENGGYQVLGVDEIHTLLPAGQLGGDVIREAPIVSFVASDPLTGQENVIGQHSATDSALENAPVRKTALDKYEQRFGKQLNKVLGEDKQAYLNELNQLQQSLEAQGIKVTIELDDDVFENREKLEGFRNMLNYAHDNLQTLKERSITEIAIVDEWDGVFGTKVDLEYDKKEGVRRLEIGDDFLNDWGESHNLLDKTSLNKLKDEMGETLKEDELEQRTAVFNDIRSSLTQTHRQLNSLQQRSFQGEKIDPKPVLEGLEQELKRLETEVIPQAEKRFENLSVKHERKLSQRYLETFESTVKGVRDQMEKLRKLPPDMDSLELNARLEKLKLLLLKGMKEIPDQRNYVGLYSSGFGDGARPSAGVMFSHAFGEEKNTVASIRAGTSAPLKMQGNSKNDIMLGLGLNHTFHSGNKLLDGANASVGIGFSRDTPFFVGLTASNSWYLTPYHGLQDEMSVVGGVHATIGSFNNLGASVDLNKHLSSKVDFEGYGEVSLWNQAAEAELELALSKNKDFYVTAGVGTNKLLYAGIGIADKYELEVGLGGISVGKDSNNLPGETGWEVGVRNFILPIPYFRHNRVPGYQFSYNDKSTEYITPNGSFMTIRQNELGENYRQAYVPDPKASTDPNKVVYRRVSSKAELDHLDQAPSREISIGPLGYLTVYEEGKKIIDDGLIQKEMNEADLGIITDQAGVLWFDRMKKDGDRSLGNRREEMPLPLYRAVHY